jgi:hypothetical protein
MIELTEDQGRAIDTAGEMPPTVVDPRTSTPYVLLRKDLYERLKNMVYDDSEIRDEELRLMLARSAAGNGWEEPGMDVYDRYDEELRKRCR